MKSWYQNETGDPEAVKALASFITDHFIPSLEVLSVQGGCCVTSNVRQILNCIFKNVYEIITVRAPFQAALEYRPPPAFFNRQSELLCCFLNEIQSKKVPKNIINRGLKWRAYGNIMCLFKLVLLLTLLEIVIDLMCAL